MTNQDKWEKRTRYSLVGVKYLALAIFIYLSFDTHLIGMPYICGTTGSVAGTDFWYQSVIPGGAVSLILLLVYSRHKWAWFGFLQSLLFLTILIFMVLSWFFDDFFMGYASFNRFAATYTGLMYWILFFVSIIMGKAFFTVNLFESGSIKKKRIAVTLLSVIFLLLIAKDTAIRIRYDESYRLSRHFSFARDIHGATRFDDMERIETLLAKDPSLIDNVDNSYGYPYGYTPVMEALHFRNYKLALYLIEKGADLKYKTDYNYTALHIAAYGDNPDIVKLLIKKGLDPKVETKSSKYTPLHFAVQREARPEIIKALLENGADVNSVDEDGRMPLHIGCHSDDGTIVAALLEYNADVNLQDTRGNNPLHDCAWEMEVDTIKALVQKGADPSIRNKKGQTPAQVARDQKNMEVYKYLVSLEKENQ